MKRRISAAAILLVFLLTAVPSYAANNVLTGETLPDNDATVAINDGTIEINTGTVESNRGLIGKNTGTVNENQSVVYNYTGGTVTANTGTVHNFGGTVTDNRGTVITYQRLNVNAKDIAGNPLQVLTVTGAVLVDGSYWAAQNALVTISRPEAYGVSNANYDVEVDNLSSPSFSFSMPSHTVSINMTLLRNPCILPVEFHFYRSVPKDLVLTRQDGELAFASVSIQYGTDPNLTVVPLTQGTDYSLDGATLTIFAQTLSKLPDGTADVFLRYTPDVWMTGCFVWISQDSPAHSICVEQSFGGTVYADMESAGEGKTVTVTASPAGSWRLKAFYLNGTAITDNTFCMPDEDVTVRAEFARQSVATADRAQPLLLLALLLCSAAGVAWLQKRVRGRKI